MIASRIAAPPSAARTAGSNSAPVVRALQPPSRAVPPLGCAITVGLVRLIPRPGVFIALMVASLASLCITRLLVFGVASSLCACLSVASDLSSSRRANAARSSSE